MSNKRIYYAHPLYSYGTEEEARYETQIRRTFPEYEVINPKHMKSVSMQDYFACVAHADKVAYWGNTRGVISECYFALLTGKPVYSLAMGRLINEKESGSKLWELEIEVAFYSSARAPDDMLMINQLLSNRFE